MRGVKERAKQSMARHNRFHRGCIEGNEENVGKHMAILTIGIGHLDLAVIATFLRFHLVLMSMMAEVKR